MCAVPDPSAPFLPPRGPPPRAVPPPTLPSLPTPWHQALATTTEMILAKGGKIDVKMAPKAVSARDDAEIEAMMERLARENEEQDGDEAEVDDE